MCVVPELFKAVCASYLKYSELNLMFHGANEPIRPTVTELSFQLNCEIRGHWLPTSCFTIVMIVNPFEPLIRGGEGNVPARTQRRHPFDPG